MKKLFLIAFALFISATFSMAQNAKSETKPVKGAPPKQVPVKMAAPQSKADAKQESTSPANQNAPHREAAVNPKPSDNSGTQQAKPVTKKDGTPDKRYKENKKLKNDGTPDKRYKENKEAGSKK